MLQNERQNEVLESQSRPLGVEVGFVQGDAEGAGKASLFDGQCGSSREKSQLRLCVACWP